MAIFSWMKITLALILSWLVCTLDGKLLVSKHLFLRKFIEAIFQTLVFPDSVVPLLLLFEKFA